MGNSVVQKSVLGRYVHDAAEMEAALFTLGEMEKECEERKKRVIAASKRQLQDAEAEFEENELALEQLQENNTKQKNISEKFSKACEFIGFAAGSLFAFVIADFISAFIVGIINYQNKVVDYLIVKIISNAIMLIGLIGVIKEKIDDKKEETKKANDAYNHALFQVDQSKAKIEISEENLENAKKQAFLIDLQVKDIQKKHKQIKNNLSTFYSYGLIPPDYRTFDCVMMLDQIFHNDLADNMRDAILLYEDKVFKGTVVKGIDKICSMLGHLSSEMNAISLRLDMINSSVAQMGDDLSRANQRLMNNQRELIEESIKSRAAAEELINETKLGRYTNEKLLESNQVLAKYANDKRMGII